MLVGILIRPYSMTSLGMITFSYRPTAGRILVFSGVGGIFCVYHYLLDGKYLLLFTILPVFFRLISSVQLESPAHSLYIDDRHNGQLQVPLHTKGYQSLESSDECNLAAANSAIYLVSLYLVRLGYFLGLKKSILIPRKVVPYLGFLSDSSREVSTLLLQNAINFSRLFVKFFSSRRFPSNFATIGGKMRLVFSRCSGCTVIHARDE